MTTIVILVEASEHTTQRELQETLAALGPALRGHVRTHHIVTQSDALEAGRKLMTHLAPHLMYACTGNVMRGLLRKFQRPARPETT